MSRIAFSIPGIPKGKDRPRASGRVVQTDAGPIAAVTVHSDRDMVRAEKAILAEFRLRRPKHIPWTGPIMLRFTAVFPPTSEFTKAQREAAARGELYHTAKPDKDNVEKLLVDALNGHAWVDDAQLQGGGVKRYGSPARIDVVLEKLPGIATPADKRSRARLDEHLAGTRLLGVKTKRTKSDKRNPPRLQKLIDAERDRDKTARAQRGLFGKPTTNE